MRVVVQRVSRAAVKIGGETHAGIGHGLLLLAGIETGDTMNDIAYTAGKITNLRIFADEAGKMNLNISQVGGQALVVSQFTLHAATKKGNRPSFIRAAEPSIAIPLYEGFITELSRLLEKPCPSGIFGADMQVELVNDGPVTIWLDSRNRE